VIISKDVLKGEKGGKGGGVAEEMAVEKKEENAN